jgi:peptide/nickel transport system ATP-binding protein
MSDNMSDTGPIVDVKKLTVDFSTGGGKTVRAVAGVDLSLEKGETLALLGESGSGKSVTLRALMRLHPDSARFGGWVNVDGRDILAMPYGDLARYRGKIVSMIFQDPGLAFDPVYRVGDQIAEAVIRHEGISKQEAKKRALGLFERVRIPSPERRLDNYPHEMSGGMRQRAMIALALACRPKVLLADEPTTALDATVQIQVLLLLRELQRELGLAVIFVTHDIGVAVEVADRIAVMYGGRIVETGQCADVIRNPSHPYTQGLLASRTDHAAVKGSRLVTIPGAPPDLTNLPPGCAFSPRCKFVMERCRTLQPPLFDVTGDHFAACLRVEPKAASQAQLQSA